MAPGAGSGKSMAAHDAAMAPNATTPAPATVQEQAPGNGKSMAAHDAAMAPGNGYPDLTVAALFGSGFGGALQTPSAWHPFRKKRRPAAIPCGTAAGRIVAVVVVTIND
jgi:hypothetical protein